MEKITNHPECIFFALCVIKEIQDRIGTEQEIFSLEELIEKFDLKLENG